MSIIKKARISADKRSIDAYGRSIELAIANYLLDNGDFPTDISDLTIEYSGDRVECETTQINPDSSIYLAECTVDGRSVEGYTYGKEETVTYDAYEVGDEVTYNNVNYRVIKNSSASESTVTLLKAEPLTVAEVNQFGAGHVNRYTIDSVGTAYDCSGFGCMAYYTSETCGYVNGNNVSTGCTTNYADSDIKYVVDAWKVVKAPESIHARLISSNDLENLGYEWKQTCPTCSNGWVKTDGVPAWFYNDNYWHWTDIQYQDLSDSVLLVSVDGKLFERPVNNVMYHSENYVVRPVITINKNSLSN